MSALSTLRTEAEVLADCRAAWALMQAQRPGAAPADHARAMALEAAELGLACQHDTYHYRGRHLDFFYERRQIFVLVEAAWTPAGTDTAFVTWQTEPESPTRPPAVLLSINDDAGHELLTHEARFDGTQRTHARLRPLFSRAARAGIHLPAGFPTLAAMHRTVCPILMKCM